MKDATKKKLKDFGNKAVDFVIDNAKYVAAAAVVGYLGYSFGHAFGYMAGKNDEENRVANGLDREFSDGFLQFWDPESGKRLMTWDDANKVQNRLYHGK